MNITTLTTTELQGLAQDCRDRAYESFERCDTDGFRSQTAGETMARVYERQITILENHGREAFPALFDLAGNLVAAKRVETRFGMSWMLLNEADPNGRAVGWFNDSKARSAKTARANDAKKGFYVGYVDAPAVADADTRGYDVISRRTDGGFSRDVVVVDNGQGVTDLGTWYTIGN